MRPLHKASVATPILMLGTRPGSKLFQKVFAGNVVLLLVRCVWPREDKRDVVFVDIILFGVMTKQQAML